MFNRKYMTLTQYLVSWSNLKIGQQIIKQARKGENESKMKLMPLISFFIG